MPLGICCDLMGCWITSSRLPFPWNTGPDDHLRSLSAWVVLQFSDLQSTWTRLFPSPSLPAELRWEVTSPCSLNKGFSNASHRCYTGNSVHWRALKVPPTSDKAQSVSLLRTAPGRCHLPEDLFINLELAKLPMGHFILTPHLAEEEPGSRLTLVMRFLHDEMNFALCYPVPPLVGSSQKSNSKV